MHNGVVTGPADYMQEYGYKRLRRIEAGEDVLVTYGLKHGLSPNVETAILVSLQTDYARYLGEKQVLARNAAARASQEAFLARRGKKGRRS
jgi:hypothetical protein